MAEDVRKTEERAGPRTGTGDGAAYRTGYGAGGLGGGADRAGGGEPGAWDAPGVDPRGRRTGTPTDGPRIAMGEEGEPDPDGAARTEED